MRHLSYALILAAVAACGNDPRITQPADRRALADRTMEYRITRYPASLGGTASRGTAINGSGLVAGFSNLPGNQTRHAVLWRDGTLVDLLTLGGPNSSVVWPGINDRGMVAGIAELAALDSLNEEWSCTAFLPTVSGHVCRGFFWDGAVMHALPTFGGEQGFATGLNDRGQVVGWAETPVHDPTCNSPQVLQFRAAIWEPKRGTMHELRPLHGDSATAATAINASGDAVGISGDCDLAVGRFSARHSVLWSHGDAARIPDLGGSAWNTPMKINEHGDVAGFANLPGGGDPQGDFQPHAFLWIRGSAAALDLKALYDDPTSEALSLNSKRQVVGLSLGGTHGTRAFLYQDGVMRDLNTLVGADTLDVLVSAQDINERGEITGRLVDHVTHQTIMFVATPLHGRE